VAVGDFKGDKKLDLVVANGDGGVSVLLGNGDGSFQAPVSYPASSEPRALVVGDFNGDGKLDLVVANGDGGVRVLLGNGDGSFQAPVSYQASSEPRALVAGVFNGDGKLDLVVANGDGGVSVLLGNGDGSFQAPVSYPASGEPRALVVGDFNGDGKLDLVVANGNGPVSLLLNQSTPFDHSKTPFLLTGAHTTLQCNQCHVYNVFVGTPTACVSCHLTDYNNATSPPHTAGLFPQDCTQCHGSSALNWTSATFNHATTGFTLTGFHVTLQCAQCHVNNNYSLTSAACWNCHQTEYNGTTIPPHKSSGFAQDCSGCHTTINWTGATFNHATTGFTLTGFHATSVQCAQCHVNNNFSLTSAACWNCHQTEYNGTTNPPHQSAGFAQDCSTCHSTTDWTGATFVHPTTPLQLTGFHATMLANNQCSLCHVGNNYTTTPSACYSCHQTDYQNTTNPGHAAAGFAQTCNTCHTFIDWTGAQYTAHDTAYFKIYSGTHNGQWTTCGDCHTDSANYATFTCIACHAHSNQASVTAEHSGNNNFTYTPTSCYTCHSGV